MAPQGYSRGLSPPPSAEQGSVVKQKQEKKGKYRRKIPKYPPCLVCSSEKQVGSQLRNLGRKRSMQRERQEVLDAARERCWDFGRMGEQL